MVDSEDHARPQRLLFKPMPEHVFDAMVIAIRGTLGDEWGAHEVSANAVAGRFRGSLKPMPDAWMTGAATRDARGVHVDIWLDDAELDTGSADAIAFEVLNALGDQDVMLLCRAFEEDGIRYRFACGTIEAGLMGSVRLVGPYARELSRMGRYGNGQLLGFHA